MSEIFRDPVHYAGYTFLEPKIKIISTRLKYVLSSFESLRPSMYKNNFESKMVDDQVLESMKILNIAHFLVSENPM